MKKRVLAGDFSFFLKVKKSLLLLSTNKVETDSATVVLWLISEYSESIVCSNLLGGICRDIPVAHILCC